MVHLDASTVNLAPAQTTPSVKSEDLPPPAAKAPYRAHPLEKSKRAPNLELDKGYAYRTFKGLITDNEVSSCYNMSVKDFERFSIHDLFKVCGFLFLSFIF